jgi:hypothetical protein
MRKRRAPALLPEPEPYFPPGSSHVVKKQIKTTNCAPIQFPKKSDGTPLLFVHRTCIFLRCGKPLAADALFGCFLPRLGPLVATPAASFLVYFPLSLFSLIGLLVVGACGHGPRGWSDRKLSY